MTIAPKKRLAIAADIAIRVTGSGVTGTGTMPDGTASYPGINPLDYGQTPTEACTTIDLDLTTFSAVAPTATDLPLLAHIRQTDTVEGVDTAESVADDLTVPQTVSA